jgi:hypothetical protein
MSFDSFQTSGNSPGRHTEPRRVAILGAVGSAIARRLTTDSVVDIQKYPPVTPGARHRTAPTFSEAA